jgi:L-malate glycosyltransferase
MTDTADDRIRVVSCVDTMASGGTELNACRVAGQLDRTRFHVTVACFRDEGPLRAVYDAHGISVVRFPIRSLVSVGAIAQAASFRSYLRRERVEVVHAHDRYMNVFAVPSSRLAGVPVLASKRWNRSSRSQALANNVAFRLASGVTTNSTAISMALVRGGLPAERVLLTPNFLDDAAFESPSTDWLRSTRKALNIPDGPVVGIVANLRPVKDHETLFRAFGIVLREVPDATLVCVGDGPSATALRQLSTDLGLSSSIRFAGHLANVPNPNSLFDVSVLPSRDEAFPNSLLEAMAISRPVVATNAGGIPEAVTHGVNGLLIPVGDAAELASAISRLLKDPSLRAAMGRAGRLRVEASHSAAAATRLYASIYAGFAGRHGN